MSISAQERFLHDAVLNVIKKRLGRDYKEIEINFYDEKKYSFEGHFPDVILKNHGMTLAIAEVETEGDMTPQRAKHYKTLSALGVKLMLITPGDMKAKAASLLWDAGLSDKVTIGTYDLSVRLP